MKKFEVKITGITPYMQHRMDTGALIDYEEKALQSEEVSKKTKKSKKESKTPEEKADLVAYKNEKGEYYIPSEHFEQCFIKAGRFVKAKIGGTNMSLKTLVAAEWTIFPEHIPIKKYDEVDVRTGVNQRTGARITTYRPRWNEWECKFILFVDDEDNDFPQATVEKIISAGGRLQGIGSYRPEHTGRFGRFKATLNEIKSK
jgi:hypothetical protein